MFLRGKGAAAAALGAWCNAESRLHPDLQGRHIREARAQDCAFYDLLEKRLMGRGLRLPGGRIRNSDSAAGGHDTQ